MSKLQAPIQVLVEGYSDVASVREVLTRRFGLKESDDFTIYPHQGKGAIPANLLGQPAFNQRGLLDQLPAKLRAFGKSWQGNPCAWVLVVVDADRTPYREVLIELKNMLAGLPEPKPRVLFRIAIEETESWFIADFRALRKAYPRINLKNLKKIQPDAVVGAAERLAEALGISARSLPGATKIEWSEAISPHLELLSPFSPSLKKLIDGVERELARNP